jgi:L-arabinokinase
MGVAVVARAPARLDVMGGIADYSGSLVLELPLKESTRVSLQRDGSDRLTLASGSRPEATVPLADLEGSYGSARAYFRRDPAQPTWRVFSWS